MEFDTTKVNRCLKSGKLNRRELAKDLGVSYEHLSKALTSGNAGRKLINNLAEIVDEVNEEVINNRIDHHLNSATKLVEELKEIRK